MRWWLAVLALATPTLVVASEPALPDYGPAVADPAAPALAKPHKPSRPHANPRIKLSYRRFAITGPNGTPVTLDGAQLDAYAISRRWFRLGFEAEGGGAKSKDVIANVAGHVWYGLTGLTMGFQFPARITPFVEGRVAIGVLGGTLSGSAVVGGETYTAEGFSVATFMYVYGVDAGIELYAIGRTYVSIALGWAHPAWLGDTVVDVATTIADGTASTRLVGADVFTFKVGLGF